VNFVFYHGRRKELFSESYGFGHTTCTVLIIWPYYLHSADNVANQNLPSEKHVNSNKKAKNQGI
jgi:hypothetical protein